MMNVLTSVLHSTQERCYSISSKQQVLNYVNFDWMTKGHNKGQSLTMLYSHQQLTTLLALVNILTTRLFFLVQTQPDGRGW